MSRYRVGRYISIVFDGYAIQKNVGMVGPPYGLMTGKRMQSLMRKNWKTKDMMLNGIYKEE